MKYKNEYNPMNYKDFIASGRKDSEWDKYLEEQNHKYRIVNSLKLVNQWMSGKELGGNDIANFLRSKNIIIPLAILKVIQDDATVISRTSTAGRGIDKQKGKIIHNFVSVNMRNIVLKEYPALKED